MAVSRFVLPPRKGEGGSHSPPARLRHHIVGTRDDLGVVLRVLARAWVLLFDGLRGFHLDGRPESFPPVNSDGLFRPPLALPPA